jgi:Polysaccharide lyase family 8, N terminal alpha-helical domain.
MKAVSRSLTMTLIENDKESDGFYPDGMFFHHGDMCYFTMYGLEALQKFNEILQLVEGTKWEFNKNNSINWPTFILMAYVTVFTEEIRNTLRARRGHRNCWRE